MARIKVETMSWIWFEGPHRRKPVVVLVDGNKEGQYKSGIALKYGSVDGGLWASISGSMINLSRY